MSDWMCVYVRVGANEWMNRWHSQMSDWQDKFLECENVANNYINKHSLTWIPIEMAASPTGLETVRV